MSPTNHRLPAIALFAALATACNGTSTDEPDASVDAGISDPIDWATEFDHVFTRDHVIEIHIDFHDATAYQQMIAAANADPDDTPFFAADFRFDDEELENVGVRLKGNSSLKHSEDDQLKSFKVHFEEYVGGQNFHGVDRFSLNSNFMDPSSMRERLSYDLAQQLGLESPRTAHAEVWVDGERYGLYTLVQQVDERFLKERFGEDDGADDGNLYKCYDACPLENWGDDKEDYWHPDYGPECEGDDCGLALKTNEDDEALNDYADIIALTHTLEAVLAGDADPEALEAIFDVEHYLRFQAWSAVLSHLDSYFGSRHNFYLYHRPTDDRIQFIPWDVNLTYGTFECPEMMYPTDPPGVLEFDILAFCGEPLAPLAQLVIEVDAYREQYCGILEELLADHFTHDVQQAWITETHALIGEARQHESVLGQPRHDYTYDDYLTAQGDTADVTFGLDTPNPKVVHALGYFVEQRIANVEAQLTEICQN